MNFFFGKKETMNKKIVEQIILQNYDQYYRLAYQYAHNEADAYDIVQNGVCNAIKGSCALKRPEYAKTWVYRIMLNECFRFLKQPKHFSYDDVLSENEAFARSNEDGYANVDLQMAIEALPERDKAIIILRYFEDKKLDEIADILDESVSTIKSRLYRCMKKMRAMLSDERAMNVQSKKQNGQVII